MSTTVFSPLPETFTIQGHHNTRSASLENQDVWESGAEQDEETILPEYENKLEDVFPTEDKSNLKTVPVERHNDKIEDYKCVVVNLALIDSLVREDEASHVTADVVQNCTQASEGLPQMPSEVTPVRMEMYETSAEQNIEEGCELPEQHVTVEASQVRRLGVFQKFQTKHLLNLDFKMFYNLVTFMTLVSPGHIYIKHTLVDNYSSPIYLNWMFWP